MFSEEVMGLVGEGQDHDQAVEPGDHFIEIIGTEDIIHMGHGGWMAPHSEDMHAGVFLRAWPRPRPIEPRPNTPIVWLRRDAGGTSRESAIPDSLFLFLQ